MGVPEIILLFFIAAGVGMHMARDGEPRRDRWNGGTALIAGAINVGLLYWGGFFS